MTIIRLKAKNQLTLPAAVAKRLGIKPHEFFAVDIENSYIKLIPVHVEPKYANEDLEAIDHIVTKEKSKAKAIKPGKDFSAYLQKLTS